MESMLTPKYSIIIPVYNRPDEIEELLESLTKQTTKSVSFEAIIIEDGSKFDCKSIVDRYTDKVNIKYFTKENSGGCDSRNYGALRATGEWLILTDSDCMFAPNYFEVVDKAVNEAKFDFFGGPDTMNESFSPRQKAMNYVMTSFLATGGIRSKKQSLAGLYFPRGFNYGIKRNLYLEFGGERVMSPGEDTDLSIRLHRAGHKSGFVANAFVYHKRRTTFKKSFHQAFYFARARIVSNDMYPETRKLVYWLPSVFVLFALFLVIGELFCVYAMLPLLLYAFMVFVDSSIKNKSPKIGIMSVVAVYVQHFGYGVGFFTEIIMRHILKKPFIGNVDYRTRKIVGTITPESIKAVSAQNE
jgi:glycosyltransferase involved in cell wall biosynthesis